MPRIAIFLFFFALSTMAQITVTGKVTDYQGKPKSIWISGLYQRLL